MRRKVEFYKWEKVQNDNKSFSKKVKEGEGICLGLGIDSQQVGELAESFSTAIIELPDGSVKNIDVEMIKFLEPHQEDENYLKSVVQELRNIGDALWKLKD